MALELQSFNSGDSKSSISKLVKVMLIIIFAVSLYVAGLMTRPALAAYNSKQLKKTCSSYAAFILSNELDKAYEQSAKQTRDNQSAEEFKKTLEPYTADTIVLGEVTAIIEPSDAKSGSCSFSLEGLKAVEGEKSDAVLNLGASKEGFKWEVASIVVE